MKCSGFNVGVTGVSVDGEVFCGLDSGWDFFRMWLMAISVLDRDFFQKF